jgi:hypothetical protein
MRKSALTIAPGQALQEVLGAEVPDSRIAKAISEGLTADQMNKDGTRSPDHKTRLQAASLALSYRHGLPLRREESLTVNITSDGDDQLAERLARSPALRRSLAKMLAAHAGDEAIDV